MGISACSDALARTFILVNFWLRTMFTFILVNYWALVSTCLKCFVWFLSVPVKFLTSVHICGKFDLVFMGNRWHFIAQ